MPIITAIDQQKKEDRFNVYLDGHFGFGIDRESLIKSKLKIGQSLSPEEVSLYQDQNTKQLIIDHLLNFISFRPRSEREIRDHLKQYLYKKKLELPSNVEVEIFDKLQKWGYLNDLEFARWWRDQRQKSHKGQRYISQELFKKGIPSEVISKALSESEIDSVEAALELLQKKQSHFQKWEGPEQKAKMQQYLLRRGYSYEESSEAISRFLKES